MNDVAQMIMQKNADEVSFALFPHGSSLIGKRILITGITGLIGRNLYWYLKDVGAKITGFCRTLVDFSEFDCPMYTNVSGLPSEVEGYDYIIHAAGYSSPSIFTKQELETISLNTSVLLRLLSLLAPDGTLLYLSSSEIYSRGLADVYDEDMIGHTNPDMERAAYIESKRCGETICRAARRVGKRAVIARVSSVYGPGAKVGDTRVLNSFIQQALVDKKVMVKGCPTSQRSFCYVTDATEMLLNVMLRGKEIVYNIGSETVYSIEQVAELVADYTVSLLEIPERSIVDNGPSVIKISTERYRKEFASYPSTPFARGLRETISWYQSLLEAPNLSKASQT